MVVRAADDLDDDLEDALEDEEEGDATVETDDGGEAGQDSTAMEGDSVVSQLSNCTLNCFFSSFSLE